MAYSRKYGVLYTTKDSMAVNTTSVEKTRAAGSGRSEKEGGRRCRRRVEVVARELFNSQRHSASSPRVSR